MADNNKSSSSKHYAGKGSDPPILDDEGVTFVNWRIRSEIWADNEPNIRTKNKARTIMTKLPDRAFEYVKHLRETVKCKDGVKILLDKLAELFIPDKLGDRIKVYGKLSNLRRKEHECVLKHIEEYMKTFREYRTLCVSSEYDDSDLALDIMISCNLSDADTKTVSAQMDEPPSSANVIQILKRIFSMTNQETFNKNKNDPDIFLAKAGYVRKHDRSFGDDRGSHSSFYERGNNRRDDRDPNSIFYERGNNRRTFRPGNKNGRSKPWDKPWEKNQRGQTKNKVGKDGRVMTCNFCESQYHFFKDCEDYTNLKMEYRKRKNNGKDVHLSMITFVGCATQNKSEEKLNALLNDSEGYALLDSGCSNTVAGEEWINKYIESLSTSDKLEIKNMPSEESFTFGDGKTHKAIRRINFPCWVGGKSADITADIVKCKIPLLLSRKAMTKAEMTIDFGKHTATVNGRTIKLKRTDSGHYALPISL